MSFTIDLIHNAVSGMTKEIILSGGNSISEMPDLQQGTIDQILKEHGSHEALYSFLCKFDNEFPRDKYVLTLAVVGEDESKHEKVEITDPNTINIFYTAAVVASRDIMYGTFYAVEDYMADVCVTLDTYEYKTKEARNIVVDEFNKVYNLDTTIREEMKIQDELENGIESITMYETYFTNLAKQLDDLADYKKRLVSVWDAVE